MEKAIKRAIEGGYSKSFVEATNYDEIFLLDPAFWQALGKACGWNEGLQTSEVLCGVSGRVINNETLIALHFYEINLTEGWDAAVKYLESLLSN